MNIDRRSFLRMTALAAGSGLLPRKLWGQTGPSTAPAGAAINSSPRVRGLSMVRFPEKTDLILLTDRPPQLETPIKYFRQDFTPNDAFFVRWHESGIPTSADTATFRVSLAGHVEKPLSLSLDQLRHEFEPVSIAAVAQCSGNSRSLFEPRVTGGQWGN